MQQLLLRVKKEFSSQKSATPLPLGKAVTAVTDESRYAETMRKMQQPLSGARP